MTATATPANGKTFSDLFKPLGSITTQQPKAPESASNEATAAPVNGGGSAASADGTVSQEQLISNLKHTEISTVTGSADQQGQQSAANASVSIGGMVQAELVVNLMDAILPAAMVAGFYAMGVKLRKSELQLTQSEKNTITPVMQKCLDTLLVNFSNPWNALAVTLTVIYGGKAMEKGLVGYIDAKQERKQSEALEQIKKKADQQANPAQYDLSNQSAQDIQDGKVAMPGDEFSEEEIKTVQKAKNYGRTRAIEWLKKQQKK